MSISEILAIHHVKPALAEAIESFTDDISNEMNKLYQAVDKENGNDPSQQTS